MYVRSVCTQAQICTRAVCGPSRLVFIYRLHVSDSGGARYIIDIALAATVPQLAREGVAPREAAHERYAYAHGASCLP